MDKEQSLRYGWIVKVMGVIYRYHSNIFYNHVCFLKLQTSHRQAAFTILLGGEDM